MKKTLALTTALILTSAPLVCAPSHAAPVLGMGATTTRVAEGSLLPPKDSKQLIVDGKKMYAGFKGLNGAPSVVKSTDGGLTWGNASTLDRSGEAPRIAVAIDTHYPGKKIVCAIWANAGSLKYSYYTDRPTGAGWSPAVSVSGDINVPEESPVIAAAPDGSIHIFLTDYTNNYYLYANTADGTFIGPTSVQSEWGNYPNSRDYAIATDSTNNVYVADTHDDQKTGSVLFLHKKAPGNGWLIIGNESHPYIDRTDANFTVSNHLSLAVYDANNMYIAYKKDPSSGTPVSQIWLAATSNGSVQNPHWALNPVAPKKTTYGTMPSVAVNARKILSVAGFYDAWGPGTAHVSINKTSDYGATWSDSGTIDGSGYPSIAIDSAGKTCVLTVKFAPSLSGSLSERDTEVGPIHFTKEK